MVYATFYNRRIKAVKLPNGLIVTANNVTRGEQKYFTYDEAKSFEEEIRPYGWRLPTMSEMMSICRRHSDSPLESHKEGYIRKNELNVQHLGERAYYWLSDSETPTEARAMIDSGSMVQIIQADKRSRMTIRLVRDRDH